MLPWKPKISHARLFVEISSCTVYVSYSERMLELFMKKVLHYKLQEMHKSTSFECAAQKQKTAFPFWMWYKYLNSSGVTVYIFTYFYVHLRMLFTFYVYEHLVKYTFKCSQMWSLIWYFKSELHKKYADIRCKRLNQCFLILGGCLRINEMIATPAFTCKHNWRSCIIPIDTWML